MDGLLVAVADYTGIAVLVAACGGFLGSVTASIIALKGYRETRTGNETRSGQLMANAETRRIEQIPHDDRSPTEQRHVDEAPDPEAPQGPGR